jgi:sugar phosphate isomerase/epimerase
MDFLAFLQACSARGVSRVSIWEDEILKVGEAAAAQVLNDGGFIVDGFNRAGPFLAETADDRCRLLDNAKRSIDRAAAFKADHVMVFPGGMPAGSRDLEGARSQAEDGIAKLLDHSRQYEILLALEPLHPMVAGDRSCIVTLGHANDICDRLGPGLSIVIDVYHVWWDDRLETEIARAGAAGRIAGFHVNDWLLPTRHLLRDRGMMGDGIIDLTRIWGLVTKAGYQGPTEVELFSDDWWQRDPGLVLDTCLARCAQIFGVETAPK